MRNLLGVLALIFCCSEMRSQITTTVYEFLVLDYLGEELTGDTSFVSSIGTKKNIRIDTWFYGHADDTLSITPYPTDTFMVSNTRWWRMQEGRWVPYLSKRAFRRKKSTKAYYRIGVPSNLTEVYKPQTTIRFNGETLYVYDITVYHVGPLYNDARYYFSFKNGVVGISARDRQFIMRGYEELLPLSRRKDFF